MNTIRKTSLMYLLVMEVILSACSLFSGGDSSDHSVNDNIKTVVFDKTSLTVNMNDSEYLKLSLTPKEYQGQCSVAWEWDKNFIDAQTDNFGAVITGKKAGATYIKAKCNGIVATCMLQINSNGDIMTDNPYIYSNYSVIEIQPNDTTTITASLLGGNIPDMEDFTWEIKDSSIADIAPSRNNCVITAKKPGSTQIVCRHPKSQYEYSFVVYCYTDRLTETFITTDFNVFSINKNETSAKTITVDLVNPINAAYKNGFTWNYADEQSKNIISVNANLNTAEIIPLKNGIAKLTVTHENSQYPLDIIVRVTTIVENTYINLSTTTLLVTESDVPFTVQASLGNYSGFVDPETFIWTIPPEADGLCECLASGNTIQIIGKRNGSFKINVRNEKSEYSRNLLVILQNQIGSAIDASMYITTEQNYIQTQVGREPTEINVRLIGGKPGVDDMGDESSNFTWFVRGGTSNGIVEIQNHTGVIKNLETRSAASSGDFCEAVLTVKPLAEGEATIIVTHPQCLYDTEITVKVFAETAIINPLTITTENSLIKLINGKTQEVTAQLNNQNPGDENRIQWTSADETKVSLSPATGQTVQLNACGRGSSQTYVTAHLDTALADKKILVLCADTVAELDSMKGIFSDNTYLRISSRETKEISVEQFGLTAHDRISWSSGNSSIVSVNGDSDSPYCNVAKVTGISEGKTTVRATVSGSEPVVFDVTVLPEGQSSEIFDENAGYLTTNRNAVVLEGEGASERLSVTGVNISSTDMALYTNWNMQDVDAEVGNPVFAMAGNPGSSVTLTANRPGKSQIRVTNKKSSNSLSINAKCGELYEWNDNYIVYITSENDVVNIINGGSTTIGCSLVNTTSKGSFHWEVTEGKDNIRITGSTNGTCFIEAVNAGQSIISVSNSLSGDITKEILVNVANTEEELKGFKYLTTKNNVVTVGEGANASVSVDVMNAEGNVISGYTWKSQNSSIAEVVGSGSVAVIYGKQCGSTKVIVENYDYCDYPLELIVNVVDPIMAAQDPYISCNNIVSCTVGGDVATVAAQLIGGKDSDSTAFSWSVVDSSVAKLYASNDSAQIKAVKEGVTQVIVSHPKASVSRSILVICEPKITTKCYISVTESIIKMSPSDDARTISASLINGDADDVYDFKWWADSYDKINMNYTGESCIIEPISSGTVNLHVSHPKASSQKDIVLYISNYNDFAFASKYVEVTTGSDYFINMEVPATGVDCEVSYRSSNPELCNVFGNSSVCTLHPGTLRDGRDSDSCTITASLITKGGAVQASAQLLVSVTRKNETRPYIGLADNTAATVITMNRGEKRNLSAKVYGNTTDTTSSGLKWEINEGSGKFAEFTSGVCTGNTVQLNAIASGKTTITVSHNDPSINPMTLYVIVAGVNEPTVNLNYVELPIIIGEDKQTLVASVKNATGEELEWSVTNETNPDVEQDFFTFATSGTKAFLIAKNPGTAKVTVRIPSNGATASCLVKVTEAPSMNFFVYDNEGNYTYSGGKIVEDRRNKVYVTSLNIYPGESKPVHWETKPAKDRIKNWYRSDNSYFNCNFDGAGYIPSWKDVASNITYYYPEDVGTLIVTGKTTEGTAILQATTESLQSDSISITNSYNYLLSLNKTLISTTPKEVHADKSILYIDYELSPACAKIIVTPKNDVFSKNLTLANGKKVGDHWEIDTHETTVESVSRSTVVGKLKFEVDGEVNTDIAIKAVNENIISSGNSSQLKEEFGNQNVKLKVFYSKHTFIPSISRKVPYANNDVYPTDSKIAKYSYYDAATNTIFLGDGEYLKGLVSVDEKNEPYSNVNIESVEFKSMRSSLKDTRDASSAHVQSEYVDGYFAGNSSIRNSHEYQLYHQKDYAIYKFKPNGSDSFSTSLSTKVGGFDTTNGLQNMYRLSIEQDKYSEVRNDTIKETTFVGYLQVNYSNYADGKGIAQFKIPVYVQVRNCPCTDDNEWYMRWND